MREDRIRGYIIYTLNTVKLGPLCPHNNREGYTMSKTFRSACRNKHSEDFIGFVASTRGKDIAKQLKDMERSKKHRKSLRSGDGENAVSYHNKVVELLDCGSYTYYMG